MYINIHILIYNSNLPLEKEENTALVRFSRSFFQYKKIKKINLSIPSKIYISTSSIRK